MPIQDSMQSLTAVAAGNSPAGADAISNTLDDYLRSHAAILRHTEARGATLTTTASMSLAAATGAYIHIDGTDAITHLGTIDAGIERTIVFKGACTLTHNATSLILPGAANIITAAGDSAIFRSEGSGNWRCISYSPASGRAITFSPTLATAQASTSGTAITFTSVPAWVKRITLSLVGVSTNGVSNPIVQIGDAGGLETSGYLGNSCLVVDGGATDGSQFTTGFGVKSSLAANVLHGSIFLSLVDAATNTWVASGVLAGSNGTNNIFTAGSKSLSATLDRVALTTVNGTDAFDAGLVNIAYE